MCMCVYTCTHTHSHTHILACISLHICIPLLVWVALYFRTKIFLWNESYVPFEFRLHSLSIVTLGENEFFLSVLALSSLVNIRKELLLTLLSELKSIFLLKSGMYLVCVPFQNSPTLN